MDFSLELGWSMRKSIQDFILQHWPVIGCGNLPQNGGLALVQAAVFSWGIISPELSTVNTPCSWGKSVLNLKGAVGGSAQHFFFFFCWNKVELLQDLANQNLFWSVLNYGHYIGKCNVCWAVDHPVKLEFLLGMMIQRFYKNLQLEIKNALNVLCNTFHQTLGTVSKK